MSRTAKTWTGMAIGGALLALTLLAGANWRGLRDGWRIARVKAQPGYAELETYWRDLGPAYDSMSWAGDISTLHRKGREAERVFKNCPQPPETPAGWPGARELCHMLRDFTGRAYQRALQDYGRRDPWRREGLPPWGAFRDLVEMRGRGEVSDGTFWRVMHVLYDNSREFIHYLDDDSRKLALKLLCGLLDDGGQHAPHRPASTLREAIADYSRTTRAAGLCDLWRRAATGAPRSRRFVRGFADFLPKNNEAPPPFEALACAWDRSLRWRTYKLLGRRGNRGRYDGVAPEWPAGEPADLAVSESGAAEGSEEVYFPEVRELIRSEGARLPPELRGAFYRVVARMYVHGLHRAVDADAEAADRPPGMPSLYLRLIAEIIRSWG